MQQKYLQYLSALEKPFKKLARLEFLQPDGSPAFALDNNYKQGYRSNRDTRAFIQGGTLTVSLKNGARRSANVTISNLDDAFDYSVNKLWYGTRIRLSMGLVLPNGEDFYLPQGVFYLKNPSKKIDPQQRTITYELVDKWSVLDGSLLGNIPYTFEVPVDSDYFDVVQEILHLSKTNLKEATTDESDMLDNVPPVFTTYYQNLEDKTYTIFLPDDTTQRRTVPATKTPYPIKCEMGSPIANLLLGINDSLVGWIGYDQTGALRIDSGTEDIVDSDKDVLWTFSPQNSTFCGWSETSKNTDVFNDILVSGEGLYGEVFYGRATNYDPVSDTNVNLIGLKTMKIDKPQYWNYEQCVDYARLELKRKTILQKSISIRSSQLFHLMENRIVAVQRTDKEGAPIEKHLITSFSLPIGETGEMNINATSVQDIDIATTISSNYSEGLEYTLTGGIYSVTGIGTCKDTEISIPPYYQGVPVERIGNSAFKDQTQISAFFIPSGVTEIITYGFQNCTALKVVSLPTSLISIGHACFYGCSSLQSVSLPPNISSISTYQFYQCVSLDSVSVPDGVSAILGNAFYGCSALNNIVLPSALQSVANNAFRGCSSLDTVYYKGTAEQWANITVGTNNTELTSSIIYYYSSFTPTDSGNYWRYVNGEPTPWVTVNSVATLIEEV